VVVDAILLRPSGLRQQSRRSSPKGKIIRIFSIINLENSKIIKFQFTIKISMKNKIQKLEKKVKENISIKKSKITKNMYKVHRF
jgi:hypothetical protein